MKNKDAFLITKDANIILYGAASIGYLMYNVLSGAGYRIVGFCDKRATEIREYMGLPVWDIGSIPYSPEECVIIVSVKNVFEHSAIANQFVEKGFFQIVFKPYAELIGCATKEQLTIGKAYDAILKREWIGPVELPYTYESRLHLNRDYAIAYESGNEVIARIPIMFIYTNNYQGSPMEKGGYQYPSPFHPYIVFPLLAGRRGKYGGLFK